jgi:opacity protein-like surface antigen
VSYKKTITILSPLLLLSSTLSQAGIKNIANHPFYIGAIAGYGSTTWQGLVAPKKSQNEALTLSTPIYVEEGGATWGVMAGYEFTPCFAVEANYIRYPNSTVYFNEFSLFSFTHDQELSLSTKTEAISLLGKIMLLIPNSNFRVFSSAGGAALYREDMIIDNWRLTPTFGAGVNYNFTEHLMGEIAGNYTAGYGESQLSPVDTYYPFLYSVTARVAYRF